MLPILYLLLSFLLLSVNANAQPKNNIKNVVGKKFISRGLEYLEIINDTTLYSSINSYNDTATFVLERDTLFIKQAFKWTDGSGSGCTVKYYDYELVSLSEDTIRFKNTYRFNYKPLEWEDTLVFIDIENLKEPVTGFSYLKLDCSNPWSGRRRITIDNLGKATLVTNPVFYSRDNPTADKNAKPKSISGQLTVKEFIKFKEILSKSLLSRLPSKRECPIDGMTSTFEILIGKNRYKSSGCDLSWIHSFLLNYLYNIDENTGFKKSK